MAAVESVLFSVLPLYFLTGMKVDHGTVTTFWEAGAMCYTAIICSVNIKMFFLQAKWHSGGLLILFVSILSWFAVAYGISAFIWVDFNWFYLWNRVMTSGTFWLTLLILVTMTYITDVTVTAVGRFFYPTSVHIIQELQDVDTRKEGANRVRDVFGRVAFSSVKQRGDEGDDVGSSSCTGSASLTNIQNKAGNAANNKPAAGASSDASSSSQSPTTTSNNRGGAIQDVEAVLYVTDPDTPPSLKQPGQKKPQGSSGAPTTIAI